MSRQIVKGMSMMLLIVALAFVTAVVSANAQSNSTSVADIPFEFVVGGQTLAAGHYSVSAATAGGDIVRVRATETEQSVFRLAMNLEKPRPVEKGKLIFNRYGNRYFLAEIWKSGERYGQRLMKSKEEKAIEHELASIHSKSEWAQSGYERIEIALVRQ